MAKKVNYRYNGGTTRKAIIHAAKNMNRIGQLLKVVGYRVNNREYVKFIGENGSMRILGFCWGYNGEGPRGLDTVMAYFGMKDFGAYTLFRGNLNGVDWIVTVYQHISYVITTNPGTQKGGKVL